MRFTVDLMAERLRARGCHAVVGAGGDAVFSKVRALPADAAALEDDTLYIGLRAPVEPPVDATCSFALAEAPGWDAAVPWLLAEVETPAAGAGDDPERLAQLVNAVTGAADELGTALERIAELAWEEGGVHLVVDALTQLLGNPVYAVDSSFKVVAITEDPDMEDMSVNWMHAARHGYVSYDVVAGLIRSDELHQIESSTRATYVESEYFYTPFANYNLRQDGKVRGHLFVVEMYRAITPGTLWLIDLAAPYVMRALQADPSFQAQRGALYEHFVVDWLEGGVTDPPYIMRQLDALSFDASSHSLVSILRLPDSSDFKRGQLARLLEDRQGCRAVRFGGDVVALFQLRNRDERAGVLRKVREICHSQQCRASVSEVQDTLMDTPRAYRQAREALRIMDAMQLPDDVVRYSDVAAYQPYLNFSSIEELDTFLHPAVVTLREYDRTHAVKLLPTLSAYLKNDRDVQATARGLFIHRNTLSYRLKRILEMCPLDLDDFYTRHRLLESILIVENYTGITARFLT